MATSGNRRPVKKRSSCGTRLLTALLTFMLTVFVIAFVLLAVVTLYINNKLNLIDYFSTSEKWVVSYTDAAQEASYSDLLLNGFDFEVEIPTGEILQDKDIVNIMLMGTDDRRSEKFDNTARCDSMILMSIDNRNDTIKLASFIRSIPVIMPTGDRVFLGDSFHYGGPAYVLNGVRTYFNVDVDRYIRVNFEIFKKLIDAIGGVDITLTPKEARALNHEIFSSTQPLTTRVYAGENHVCGHDALQYARLRYIDSDWRRMERQRNVLRAIQAQASTLSVLELNAAADEILPCIQTNLTKTEITSLLFSSSQILNYTIDDVTIPIEGDYLNMDYQRNSDFLQEYLYGKRAEESEE